MRTIWNNCSKVLFFRNTTKNKTESMTNNYNILFELKNVEKLEKIHDYQLLSYLDGSNAKYGTYKLCKI